MNTIQILKEELGLKALKSWHYVIILCLALSLGILLTMHNDTTPEAAAPIIVIAAASAILCKKYIKITPKDR